MADPVLNNKRRRSLAERIIDLIAEHDLFEDVKIYVNKECLMSPELGDGKSIQKRTKGKTRYAVVETPDYARNLMPKPVSIGKDPDGNPVYVDHVIVLTFDGPLYDRLNADAVFSSAFANAIELLADEYGCIWTPVEKSQIFIYPVDPSRATPFASAGT